MLNSKLLEIKFGIFGFSVFNIRLLRRARRSPWRPPRSPSLVRPSLPWPPRTRPPPCPRRRTSERKRAWRTSVK
jgi:hypothetical protein